MPAEPEEVHRDGQANLIQEIKMGVPKRKTSKARRDKRRANHGVATPALATCPQCSEMRPVSPGLPQLRVLQGPPCSGTRGRIRPVARAESR